MFLWEGEQKIGVLFHQALVTLLQTSGLQMLESFHGKEVSTFGHNAPEFFELGVLPIQFFYRVFIKFVALAIGCGLDGNAAWFARNEAGKIGHEPPFREKEMRVISAFYIAKGTNGTAFQKKYFAYWCSGADQLFIFRDTSAQRNSPQALVHLFIELNNLSNYILHLWHLNGAIWQYYAIPIECSLCILPTHQLSLALQPQCGTKRFRIMLKLLITGALIYFVYRFFIAPPAIGNQDAFSDQQQQNQSKQPSHDDEYIDYEEVD